MGDGMTLTKDDEDRLLDLTSACARHRRRRPRRRGDDMMGYPLKPFLAYFSDAEINAAKTLAIAEGYKWDVVNEDPRVGGWRFLKAAKIVSSSLSKGADAALSEHKGG